MPTYEYQCDDCDHRFEVIQKMSDAPIKVCERCKGPVHRVIFAAGIMFKGSGFHVNDYPSSGSNGGSKTAEKKSTSETKPESKN